MSQLVWDKTGERYYETGVDRGVLFTMADDGSYEKGVAWNGLTAVNESPSGAEKSPQYADNMKYLELIGNEEFGLTIECYHTPDEFDRCDGTLEIVEGSGVTVGQQARENFGFSYRTRIGNDVKNDAYGYKIHLVYGCSASPSERAHSTVNDSPEASTLSYDIGTTPIVVDGFRSVSHLIINSTKIAKEKLKTLEDMIYGTESSESKLPLPSEVMAILQGE